MTASAAARLRLRQEPVLDNKRYVKVHWGLGKGHVRLLGREKQRGRNSTDGSVGRRCRREEGKTGIIYRGVSAGMMTA
jgi:hypothetical protein